MLEFAQRNHLDEIAPLFILAVLAIGFIIAAFVPRRLHLGLAIAVSIFWLSVNRYENLPFLGVAAKISFFVPLLMVILAADFHQGVKRKVSKTALVYIMVAIGRILFCFNVADFKKALLYNIGWLISILAAISVVRVMSSAKEIRYVLHSIAIGCFFGVGFAATAFVLDSGCLARGNGRFFPYGANPNHIGTLFLCSLAVSAFLFVRTSTLSHKLLLAFLFAISAATALATGSRSIVFLSIVILIPLAIDMTKRPMAVAGVAAILVGTCALLISQQSKVNTGRLTDLESSRTEVWAAYMHEIKERPVTGLLLAGNRYRFDHAPNTEGHAHNGYVFMLYTGGLFLCLPIFMMIAHSSFQGLHILLNRHRLIPMAYTLFFPPLLAVVYAQGMANQNMFDGTNAWAFIHILCSVFVVTEAGNLKAQFAMQHGAGTGAPSNDSMRLSLQRVPS